MKTLKQVIELFPYTTESQWRQHSNGKGWVFKTAHVDESAYVEGIVSGKAWVSGKAQVSGGAWVSEEARVFGEARVSGKAWVSEEAWAKSPLYIQGTRHPLSLCSFTEIAIGCKIQTIKAWKENYKEIGRAEGYTDSEIKEYGEYIEIFASASKRFIKEASVL